MGEREYDATNIGFKYHMNDIAASIGLGNLKGFNKKLKILDNIHTKYKNNLNKIPGITLMDYIDDRKSSNWLFPILVENRSNFIKMMRSNKIPVSVVHLGIDKNKIFGEKNMNLINQRFFDDNQIHIPINSDLSDENIEYIINTIKKGW